MSEFQERLGNITVQVMSGLNTIAYQLSEGRVGGSVPSGAPICLLTTTGRRTGRRRTVPLLFIWDGDDMIIVASNGGMSRPPAWYLNLVDDSAVGVEVHDWRQDRRAVPVDDADRPDLWSRLVEAYLHFEHYQLRTERQIPLLRLVEAGPRKPARSSDGA